MGLTEGMGSAQILRPGRSKLEPHRELIAKLLDSSVGYREIPGILLERCGVRISPTAVFQFVKVRAQGGPRRRKYTLPEAKVPGMTGNAPGVRERLAALKGKSSQAGELQKVLFDYEEGRPLTLRRKG